MREPRACSALLLAAAAFALAFTPVIIAGESIDPHDPPHGRFNDQWVEIYMGGQKVGYGHSTMARDGGLVHTANDFRLRIGRLDQPVDVEMAQTTTETVDGRAVTFATELSAAVMKTRTRGRIEDGRVTITTSQYGMEQEQTFDYPEGALMTWGLFRESLLRGLQPGTEYTLPMYAPELRMDDAVLATTDVGAPGTFEHRGRRMKGQKVTVRLATPVGSMEMVSWVDENGLPLKAEMPAPGLGNMVMVTVDEETALSDFVPPELFLTSTISANRTIPRQQASRIRYGIRAKDADAAAELKLSELPETAMQSVTQKEDGAVEVVVTRVPFVAPGNTAGTKRCKQEFLEGNLMINVEDPKLIELAKRAAAGQRDPYKLADRLRRFVTDYVRNKSLTVGFATASEVGRRREGDCSEHGVLLAALGRLNGLPSRVVVGLAYVPVLGQKDDIFGYHLWTQFFIDGRWVDVDAALGETECSPTRIAFATSSLKNSGLADLSLPILTKIGAIEVDVLDIEQRVPPSGD